MSKSGVGKEMHKYVFCLQQTMELVGMIGSIEEVAQ